MRCASSPPCMPPSPHSPLPHSFPPLPQCFTLCELSHCSPFLWSSLPLSCLVLASLSQLPCVLSLSTALCSLSLSSISLNCLAFSLSTALRSLSLSTALCFLSCVLSLSTALCSLSCVLSLSQLHRVFSQLSCAHSLSQLPQCFVSLWTVSMLFFAESLDPSSLPLSTIANAWLIWCSNFNGICWMFLD